jgi:hypothetical protein
MFLHSALFAECGHGYSFSFHNGWFPFSDKNIWLLATLVMLLQAGWIYKISNNISVWNGCFCFFLFRAGCYYFSILLSFAYGLVSFYLKMVVSKLF